MQMWQTRGPDQATIANLAQSRMLDTHAGRIAPVFPHDFGTPVDEMDLSFLLGRKTLVKTITWNVTDAPGTVLHLDELVPNPLIMSATGGVFEPTLLGYVANAFQYWRGGLKLTIQFVISQFHTGRIVVCSHYGGKSGTVPALADAMGQYANVIDATPALVCHEVEFPWRSNQEMLSVSSPEKGSTYQLSERTMGEYSIRVVNPLRAPDTVAQSVSINVYLSACDDFQLDFVRPIPNELKFSPSFTV
jgi:hypothetical protein